MEEKKERQRQQIIIENMTNALKNMTYLEWQKVSEQVEHNFRYQHRNSKFEEQTVDSLKSLIEDIFSYQ